jgi:hypothetical protein
MKETKIRVVEKSGKKAKKWSGLVRFGQVMGRLFRP